MEDTTRVPLFKSSGLEGKNKNKANEKDFKYDGHKVEERNNYN